MKKLLSVFMAAVIALLMAGEACAQFSRLSFGKYGISSISPESFRAVSGSAWLDVTNPDVGFRLSEINGKVYKNGTPFVSGRAVDVYIPKGTGRRTFTGRAELCSGISLWNVLSCIAFDPDDYSVDISMRITLDTGETRVVSKSRLPLRVLLKLM
ncbi:MAG: hypothetical protein IJ402_03605 [Bacteroidales bacterium]|nr:hypothetical protein [Bacteroidales bacterium]